MKEWIRNILIVIVVAAAIVFVRWLLADACAWCGSKMMSGNTYTIQENGQTICESCYKTNESQFTEVQ